MDTSLVAVVDVVAETEGLYAAATRSSEPRGPSFASLLETDLAADRPQPLEDNPYKHDSPHAPPALKTDNMQTDEATNLANTPSNNSHGPTDRPAVTETRPQPARSQNVEKQEAASDTQNPTDVVKLWLSQYSQTAQHGKEALTNTMQPRAGFELAQMIADSHGRQIGPAAANAVKPAGLTHLHTVKGKTDSGTVLPTPLADLNQALGKSNQGKNGQIMSLSAKASIAAAGASQQGGSKANSDVTSDLQNPQTLKEKSPVLTRSVLHAPVQETLLAGRNHDSADAPNPAPDKASIRNQLHSLLLAGNRHAHAQTGSASPNQAEPPRVQSQAAAAWQNSPLPPEQPGRGNPTDVHSSKKLKAGEQKQTLDNALTTANSKKLNPEGLHLQVRAAQTKNPSATTSKDGSQSHLDRTLLQNNAQGEVTKPSSAVAHTAKTAESPMQQTDSPARQVTEYIQSSLRPGDQQITIRLNPPELGRVLIKFGEQQQQITGLLEVTKLQTRYEIEQALPQIIKTLHDAGVQVKKLEVVLNDQAEQQNLKDQSQSLHDGFSHERNSAQDAGIYDGPADEWLTNDNAAPDAYQPQSYVTDDSIDMLL